MSSLRVPQLGPIVGHTTDTSARIWIRGSSDDAGANIDSGRRTIGVIAVTHEGGRRPRLRRAYYFRLRREYDRTGTFTLGGELGLKSKDENPIRLKPDTEYVVRVGTLNVDDPNPEDESLSHDELAVRLPNPEVWLKDLERLDAERSEARFHTFPSVQAGVGQLSFILGSCRYPGLLWKTKHSDAIFGPLLQEAQGRDGRDSIRMVLMVGDQIYADMLSRHVPIGLADTFEEFQERYHSAFGSQNMRRLLRQMPTYMILDDHEIEDNWTQDRIRCVQSRRVFNLAIDAYRSYQWIHGPTSFGKRLFYQFACSGYPFFVLDTRTQRFMDDVRNSVDDNHLMGRPSLAQEEPSQLEFLLHWLSDSQKRYGDTPKFIVSSSVFAPNPMDARTGRQGSDAEKTRWYEGSDSWPAFPTTRKAILSRIVDQGIQNVVFLSGDVHCSNVAKIRFSGSSEAERLRVFSITSSAFYWPYPFSDGEPSSFVHNSRASEQEDTFTFSVSGTDYLMDYEAWNFTQEDNFCRVDIDAANHQILVTAFGTKGEILETGGWFGDDRREIRSTLALANW